ncbi:ATP-binding protein [Chrysiogenes arsenatis]|uniref:ATP-binding protein n=1 Tax=Chrysiogenes arsenatis TaxID=309797 RepID=UPI0003FBDF32|nr:HAMP domain-containing sensor histidine kinase [Chrysiogenes arsenatis]
MNKKLLFAKLVLPTFAAVLIALASFGTIYSFLNQELDSTLIEREHVFRIKESIDDMAKAMQQSVLAREIALLAEAAQLSLLVYDRIDTLNDRNPQHAHSLREMYTDYYQQLSITMTLLQENRFDEGRPQRVLTAEIHDHLQIMLDQVIFEIESRRQSTTQNVNILIFISTVTLCVVVLLNALYLIPFRVIKPMTEQLEALQEHQQKLQNLLTTLQARIDDAVTKAREQDRLIFEQNRRQSLATLLINLAHHWRQPLNITGLLIQEIEEEFAEGTVDQEWIHKQVDAAMEHLTRLSDSLTSFTDLYASSNATLRNYYVITAMEHALAFASAAPWYKRITIRTDIPPHAHIMGIPSDMVEIFSELLQNTGEVVDARNLFNVTVTIKVVEVSDDTLSVEYRDTAGGIVPEILPQIFDPYVTTAFKAREKGLGLFMLKRLIQERYNGTIAVQNEGEGVLFTLTLRNNSTKHNTTIFR